MMSLKKKKPGRKVLFGTEPRERVACRLSQPVIEWCSALGGAGLVLEVLFRNKELRRDVSQAVKDYTRAREKQRKGE